MTADRLLEGRLQDQEIVRHGSGNFLYWSKTSEPEPRVGIFIKGDCQLQSLFVAEPLIRRKLANSSHAGTCCMHSQGLGISDARPDVLLQSRLKLPREVLADVLASGDGNAADPDGATEVKLPLEYFRPVLFDRTFTVPGWKQLGEFPKTVIAISIAPSVVRSAYRHRTKGYLIDPGGFWLNESMERFLSNPSAAKWFRDNFTNVGRLSVDEFAEAFAEVVRLLKRETGAHLIVANTLVVDPSDKTHNYQFSPNNQMARRRAFDVVLRDLSRELDFHILDIDKCLKLEDVSKQIEFSHFPLEYMKPVATEAFRILMELEIL